MSSRARWPTLFLTASLLLLSNIQFASALIIGGTGNKPVRDAGWPRGAVDVANLKTRIAWWEGPPFGGGQMALRVPRSDRQVPGDAGLVRKNPGPALGVGGPRWRARELLDQDQRQGNGCVGRLGVYCVGAGQLESSVQQPAQLLRLRPTQFSAAGGFASFGRLRRRSGRLGCRTV